MLQKIFSVLLILLSINTVAQPPMRKAPIESINRKWLNLPYANQSTSQQLDIYLPDTGKGPFPVIISIHGGGFMFGDKQDGQLLPMLTGLKHGYAVVSINYRLSQEAIFPAQINDVKAAIRFLKANAAIYQLNKEKIALWGGSAGGHLAALAGTTFSKKVLEDTTQGNALENSAVQAVVDWFGPIHFGTMDDQFAASGKGNPNHNNASSPESKLLGVPVSQAANLVANANAANYIDAQTPPFFIQHGKNDPMVPTEQSLYLYEQLLPVLGKDKVTLSLLDNAGHGGRAFETAANIQLVLQFLNKHLQTP
jgi:acetyl esterase/lipase